MKALDVSDVTKTFKVKQGSRIIANDKISLKIDEGKIYGLLGPNGAGKSTLINIISGIMLPDHGTLTVFGKNIVTQTVEAKKMMGVVPQEIVTELAFTVQEILHYNAGMYGVPFGERAKLITQVLSDLELEDKRNERARNLSGGMKRRLMIAKAIVRRPRFLILDEPTSGVDVALRQKTWELVRRMNKEGMTILFTTHYIEEAERLCEEISLINHGRVIKEGRVSDIQREFSENVVAFELFDLNVAHLAGVAADGKEFHLPITELDKDMSSVIRHYGSNLKSIKNEAASLEQIFLKLTSQ
ncbi:MAG: ABC transporter ATP-binding protein [Patescibacteria group bacterium]|nr:ABC transporter ATP-binding protein [Patescibacteria group bacterium]